MAKTKAHLEKRALVIQLIFRISTCREPVSLNNVSLLANTSLAFRDKSCFHMLLPFFEIVE